MWYAAHVVMIFRYCEGKQTKFPVQENVYLIEAPSSAEAQRIAVDIGRKEGSYEKPSAIFEDVPVRLAFAGVRKVVECLPADKLETGTELTYTEYLVDSEEALERLLDGDEVRVTIRDFSEDAPPTI